ncbi:phage tail assembly protein, partial [Pseudomonas aeruginosa]
MTQENRLPGWLTLDADAALVLLSRPAQGNGDRVDTPPL